MGRDISYKPSDSRLLDKSIELRRDRSLISKSRNLNNKMNRSLTPSLCQAGQDVAESTDFLKKASGGGINISVSFFD